MMLLFLKSWWAVLKQHWHDHGTKILGYGGMAFGALEFIDDATLQLVQAAFGPKYGPMVSHGLKICGGILVARRGYANSRRAAGV